MATAPIAPHSEDSQEVEDLYRDDTMEEIAAELAPLGTIERDSSQCEWYNVAMADLREYEALQARKAEEAGDEEIEDDETDSEEDVEESEEPEDFFRTSSRDSTGRGCDDDDWVVDQILAKKRKKWINYYQVKWKGWPTFTWETEEDMEEYGWGDWLVQFETDEINRKRQEKRDSCLWMLLRLRSKAKSHRVHLVQAEKDDRYALYNYHREACRLLGKITNDYRSPSPRISRGEPGSFDPDEYWPDYVERIKEAFRPTGWIAVRIQNIVNPSLQSRFTELFNDPQSGVPVMTFHGTSAECVPGIITGGLRVPGRNGVVVRNGSSYGVGIYMSTAATTPCSYIRGPIMIVVVSATLVGTRFLTSTQSINGDWIVVSNEEQVLPCYIVEVQQRLTLVQNNALKDLPYLTDIYRRNDPWPCLPFNMGANRILPLPLPVHTCAPEHFYQLVEPTKQSLALLQATPAQYRSGTKGSGGTRSKARKQNARGVTQRERKGLRNTERNSYKPRKH
jgi:hypothetical protein